VTAADVLALIGAGALAGVVSTVAGLASLVSYPVLLALGLSPLSANVTNTVALTFTGAGAAAGSRPELAGQGGRVLRLGAVTMLGGAAGAAVLLLTPPGAFEYVAPALIGGSSLALLLQPVVRRPTAGQPASGPAAGPASGEPASGEPASGPWDEPPVSGPAAGEPAAGEPAAGQSNAGLARGEDSWPLRAVMFSVAVYIGYFGAAGGILMLAVLAAMLRESLARINALKNVVSGLANAVASIGFAVFGPVRWAFVVPLAAGFLAGGWAGPAIVRRLPGPVLRALVGAAGLLVAVKLGLSTYR
jgi:uncharacterized membrane protein YfcA